VLSGFPPTASPGREVRGFFRWALLSPLPAPNPFCPPASQPAPYEFLNLGQFVAEVRLRLCWTPWAWPGPLASAVVANLSYCERDLLFACEIGHRQLLCRRGRTLHP